MELGEHHLDCRHPLAVRRIHHVHGDATAVIDDGDGIVDVDGDVNFFGVACEGLVDRVIHDLVYQMVQPHITC